MVGMAVIIAFVGVARLIHVDTITDTELARSPSYRTGADSSFVSQEAEFSQVAEVGPRRTSWECRRRKTGGEAQRLAKAGLGK